MGPSLQKINREIKRSGDQEFGHSDPRINFLDLSELFDLPVNLS